MIKVSKIWQFVRKYKYLVVISGFVVLMGFVDENSWWERSKRKSELKMLRSEIKKYTDIYERDTRYLNDMNSDPAIITQIARERYYMKAEDEDIFVFEDENKDENIK